MIRSILFLYLLSIPTVISADSEVQTDWSGGPGLRLPVTEWNDQFINHNAIQWRTSGYISLIDAHAHIVDGDFDNTRAVYAEDIDCDGDMDVVGASFGANEVAWWENIDGTGIAWIKHTLDQSFYSACSIHADDIDDDGDVDILGAASGTGGITWWENVDSGSTWIKHSIDPSPLKHSTSVFSADIDGDGDIDVLSAQLNYGGHISWWENLDGAGSSWIEHSVDTQFTGARDVHSDDIDGDADMDILGAAQFADEITWWENADGTGTSWIEHSVAANMEYAWSVNTQDVDNDGDVDILGAAVLDCSITWWENAYGSGEYWIEHTVDDSFEGAISVYSDDIDNDGDKDIVGAACLACDLTWWENSDGSASSWIKHTLDDDLQYASSVYAEDVNGDGNMDILGVSANEDDIIWYDFTEFSPEGSLHSGILNTESSPQWASLDWNGFEPFGTEMYFQYRSSDDPSSMGSWSDPIFEPCLLSGLVDQYFQYRIILETDNPDLSPTLQDVSLFWDPFGIEDSQDIQEIALLGAIPNPAHGNISVCFALPEYTSVCFNVFDISGRLFLELYEEEYAEGEHSILLGRLNPGVYFCQMISGEFTATQRFVVLE